MVVRLLAIAGGCCWLLVAQSGRRGIDQLDGPARAKALAALAALIILGVAMMLLTWLGGRAVRRYRNSGMSSRRRQIDPDDWATKPVVGQPSDASDAPSSSQGENNAPGN